MSTGGKSGGGASYAGSVASEKTSLAFPITFYKERTGKYPSNAQVWWAMKRPPELGSDTPPKYYLEVFDPGLRYQVGTGNTPVAKGHFVLDAFNKDRAGVSKVSGIAVETSNGHRPSAVAFFAGRVFYAGVNSIGFNTKIYFSQILERSEQVPMCYQIEDPTAEDLRDLLPTDGGVIDVPEIGRVYHMVAYGASLFVFANNGVWQISGSSGSGFRADDYAVSKLSGVPTLTNMSFVLVEGAPMWWSLSDIWTLAVNDQGQYECQSVTDKTIKTFYQSIPDQSKKWAKGAYDPVTGLVQYLYRSTTTTVDTDNFKYDRILTFNVKSGAFSPWDASNDRVVMKGIFDLQGNIIVPEDFSVVVNDDAVAVDTDTVIAEQTISRTIESKIKYIVDIKDA